jgi:hypothetical protein
MLNLIKKALSWMAKVRFKSRFQYVDLSKVNTEVWAEEE